MSDSTDHRVPVFQSAAPPPGLPGSTSAPADLEGSSSGSSQEQEIETHAHVDVKHFEPSDITDICMRYLFHYWYWIGI
jgi:hypothetical protein